MSIDPLTPFAQSDKDREFVGGLIRTQRAESAAEEAAKEAPVLDADDVMVTGAGVEPAGNLSNDEFEAFREAFSSEPGFSPRGSRRFVVNDADQLDAPDPREVIKKRSAEAVEQDRQQQARVTYDVDTYASDPNSYDFPFVDTPTEFNQSFKNENSLIPGNIDKDAVQRARDDEFDF